MNVAGTLNVKSCVFSANPATDGRIAQRDFDINLQRANRLESQEPSGRVLTQIGVHDKEIEVLLKVASVF